MYDKDKVTGMAIYCADPTINLWKKVKREVIHHEKVVVAIGILGGPVCLARPDDLDIEFQFVISQLQIAINKFRNFKDVFLFGHDCGFYTEVAQKNFSLEEKEEDIKIGQKFLEGRLPQLFLESRKRFNIDMPIPEPNVMAYFTPKYEIDFKKVA